MTTDLIIGFTGTPAGRDAVALGRRLALATGARPTVVHVRSPKPPNVDPSGPGGDWSWGASVASTLDEARALLADVPDARFTAVAEASVARVLHRMAEDAAAPLIVLGTTRRSGIGRAALGTTADAVIHVAPCAVAVAPAGYATANDQRPFGLVVAAVDGGQETERVARVAGRVARRAGATLRLVTVVLRPFRDGPLFAGGRAYATLDDAVRESAEGTLDRAAGAAGGDVPIERHVLQGTVRESLAREAAEADLIVIGSRAYGRVRRVVLGSETGNVVAAAPCPVLVVPRRAAEAVDEAVVPLAAAGAA